VWQTVPRAVPASVVPDPEQGLLVRSDTADFAPRVNPTTGVDERDGRQVLAGDRVTVHAVVGASAVFSSALTAIVDGVGPVAATRGYGVGVFAGLGDQLALGEVEIPPTIGAIGYLLGEDRRWGGRGFGSRIRARWPGRSCPAQRLAVDFLLWGLAWSLLRLRAGWSASPPGPDLQ
jgi:hypothetical protein